MNFALIQEIVSVIFQLVESGIKYGPDIWNDLKLAFEIATSGTTLTDDQKAQADLAVSNAHQALQSAVALDAQNDG